MTQVDFAAEALTALQEVTGSHNDDNPWLGVTSAVVLLQDHLSRIRAMVDQQAEDDGLWFEARYASEAYLQQELRKLHALIERLTPTPEEDPHAVQTVR